MIEVEHLERRHGDLIAVNDVSFSITKGEVVGLLGQNGAGKTTLMQMLTGFLEPSAGRITVDGLDMARARRAIQRRTGYLPENCPVYPDMTVLDYLDYQAALHGLAEAERPDALRRAVARTGLEPKALDTVATLSKGYRQRVGVAQAILHGPDMVILDEPTNGLDPAQIREMRALIRTLAETATVIVSTHVLREVQAVGDRALIMHQGRIAADTRLDDLGDGARVGLTVDAAPERVHAALDDLEGVAGIDLLEQTTARHRYAVRTRGRALELAPAIARRAQEHGLAVYALQPESRDLEAVFAEISEAA